VSALVPVRGMADSMAELFEPVDAEPIAALLTEYGRLRATMVRVAGIFTDDATATCLPYFIEGNQDERRYSSSAIAEELFRLEWPDDGLRPARRGAIPALNAAFWDQLLKATDVLEVMPAERRKKWHEQIEKRDVPEFTESTIRSTLAEHLASRHKYFAERVDGLFRALSPEHKTNLPSGFRSKLILSYVVDSFGFSSSRIDYLVDLRVIVAKFMGRNDVGEGGHTVNQLTRTLVNYARRERRGEWVSVDGGAIEIKLHKSGTCHVRVHEELARRLNGVLAYLHPGAIPESARTRPKRGSSKKAAKTVELMARPLPFTVVRALSEFSRANSGRPDAAGSSFGSSEWEYGYTWTGLDKHVRAEVERVIESIGGTSSTEEWGRRVGRFAFDYNAHDVLGEIVASGCIPDHKSHQYYPTPPALAARVVELAEIGPDHKCLEPSAGQGAIASLLPADRTICVEVSALHCAVLQAKGLTVTHGDFLKQSRIGLRDVDVVVMNPPFDRGQWVAHVQHAAEILADSPLDPVWMRTGRGASARLVAVLPESAPSHLDLAGWNLTWSEPIEFPGISIRVVILVAQRG
jgi:hypothetical protein